MATGTFCNPEGRLEGFDSTEQQKGEWAVTGLRLARADRRHVAGQGLSCWQAGWKAGLQSLPPGLEMHDHDLCKVPLLSTLGLGSRKLCLPCWVHLISSGRSPHGQLPTAASQQTALLQGRFTVMHHHLPQTLFPDTSSVTLVVMEADSHQTSELSQLQRTHQGGTNL